MKKHVLAMILLLIAMAIPAMAELKLPEGIREIGDQAFYGNPAIDAVVVPDGAERIGSEAFADCPNLSEITLPDSIQFIADDAFSGSDYVRVSANADSYAYEWAVEKGYIESTLPPNPASDFEYSISDGECTITRYVGSSTEVVIPNEIEGASVTSIGDDAFYECNILTSITIPEGVTSIGEWAFNECGNLTHITIPESVTTIGEAAFGDCARLTEITVDKNNTEYSSEDGILFSKDKSTLICCPPGIPMNTYSIPSSVTYIANYAFYECSSLTSIMIPKGVTSIGDYAFYWCSSLTSITLPEGVTSIGVSAFYRCSNLTSITLPEGVTSIGECAFNSCESLTSITIPEGVTSIGYGVFKYCESLTSITIPEGVTSIGYGAFNYCSNLTSIYIPESVTQIIDPFWRCNENLVIYGETGSYAESWAEENGFPFSTHYYEEVVLPKEAISLGGRVCLEDGSGLSGVKVTICYNKDIFAGSAETDSDGYWSCDGLRPNQEYTISYACSGYGIPVSTCVVKYKSMVLEDVIAAPNLAEAIRFEQPLHGQNVSPYEGLHLVWTPVEGAKYYEYSARYLDQEEAFIFRRKTELTEAWIPIPDMQEDNTLQLWVAAFVDSDDEMISNQIIRVTTNAPAEIPEHTCQWGEEYNVGESWYQKCTICGITIARTKPEAGDSVCAHGNLRSCCCICVGYHDWIRNENIDMGAGDSIFDWYCCMRCGESINSTVPSDQEIYYCALEKIPQNGNPLDDSIVEEYLRNKMNGYVSNKNQTAILQALRKAPTVYQKLYLYSVAEYNYELTDGIMQYRHNEVFSNWCVLRINEAKYPDTNEFLSVWFHEVGHAIDGNSGAANTYKTNDTVVINGVEQNELFFYLMLDAKTLIYKCINQIENDGSLGCTLTAEERERIASAILDPNQDKNFKSEAYLDKAMRLLVIDDGVFGLLLVKSNFEYTYRDKENKVLFANSQMTQDILGGLSNNYIAGDFGHGDAWPNEGNEYWYKNGKPTYQQCHEAFAEFFSAQILGIDAIKNNNATVFPFGTNRMNSMCNELKEVYRKRHRIEA